MKIFKKLDHISIGVEDIHAAKKLFVDILGGEDVYGPRESRGVSGFNVMNFKLGGGNVEVVSPVKIGEGGVGRYIAKYGQGFHHMCMGVEDLKEAIKYFEGKGIGVLAPNFDNPSWKHCFLNPKDTFGAMIQVFEINELNRHFHE